MVKASYKDYVPKEFVLTVNFMSNLDGKRKYLDLGTHIFYKASAVRPQDDFKFSLHGVTDNKVDDDLSSYNFALHNDLDSSYYSVSDQDNVIEIFHDPISPKIGRSNAVVSTDSNMFYPSNRHFFALKG